MVLNIGIDQELVLSIKLKRQALLSGCFRH